MKKNIKESEVKFYLSELPAEKTAKGENLEKVNYCTKYVTLTETKEINGQKIKNKHKVKVFLNYDSMLQQILIKHANN